MEIIKLMHTFVKLTHLNKNHSKEESHMMDPAPSCKSSKDEKMEPMNHFYRNKLSNHIHKTIKLGKHSFNLSPFYIPTLGTNSDKLI